MDEINARFSHLPPFRHLKSFRNGISCLPRWTGAEYKAMSRVYLGVIKGLLPNDGIMMVKQYLDIQRLAHYESHTDSTLALLENAIKGFWEKLMNQNGVFVKHGLLEVGWYAPKVHLSRHYVQEIREKGILPFCSTDRTEAFHRPIKDSYRASNRGHQASTFIVRDEARDFGWEIWYQDVKNMLQLDQDIQDDDAGQSLALDDQEQIHEDEIEELRIQGDANQIKRQSPVQKTVSLSKRRRYKGFREIGFVSTQYNLEHLEEATRNYLIWIQGNRQPLRRKRKLSEITFRPRLELKVSDSVSVQYPVIHDDYVAINDMIYATPRYPYFQNKDWMKARYKVTIL